MLNYRREMYESVENKFLFDGKKYSVYVNGEEEINKLIMHLKYDFVKHESEKNPNTARIQDTEFIVSCDNKLSLVAYYPSDRMMGFLTDFVDSKLNALPLYVFIDKNATQKYPEYFI